MLEYVATKPAVGAAQVTLPYWMALSDHELVGFFRDLHQACPNPPLVHWCGIVEAVTGDDVTVKVADFDQDGANSLP
jgi:hypothetical protein